MKLDTRSAKRMTVVTTTPPITTRAIFVSRSESVCMTFRPLVSAALDRRLNAPMESRDITRMNTPVSRYNITHHNWLMCCACGPAGSTDDWVVAATVVLTSATQVRKPQLICLALNSSNSYQSIKAETCS